MISVSNSFALGNTHPARRRYKNFIHLNLRQLFFHAGGIYIKIDDERAFQIAYSQVRNGEVRWYGKSKFEHSTFPSTYPVKPVDVTEEGKLNIW